MRGSEVVLAGVEQSDGAEAGMLGTALLGGIGGLGLPIGAAAAGLGSALLLTGKDGGDGTGNGSAGGTDNGGGDGGPKIPTVVITEGTQSVNHVVNEADHSNGVEIGGNGTPGGVVKVVVEDVVRETVVDENGNWEVIYTPGEIPGGERETDVSVTITTDGGSTSVTDVVVLDTVTGVTFNHQTVETDGTINLIEESDGFTLTGTTEVGASVVVTIDGKDYSATVNGTDWTLDVASGVIAGGEYELSVKVTATDAHNNVATVTENVKVDTVVNVTVNTTTVATDGTINKVEESEGFTITGTTDAGCEVMVSLEGTSFSQKAVVTGTTWSILVPAGTIAAGEYDLNVKATATDVNNNTKSATGAVHVDTVINVDLDTSKVADDGIVNKVERLNDGLVLTGSSDAFAKIDVTFNGVARSTTANEGGVWTANWPTSAIPAGEHPAVPVTVRAEDAAGNVKTISRSVEVDTFVNRLGFDEGKIAGDDILNNAEAAQGLTFGGVVEVNSQSVQVIFSKEGDVASGVHKTATLNKADGTWSVTFTPEEIAQGTYTANVRVVATDRAGNVASINDTFAVDTDPNAAPDVDKITTNGTAGGVSGFSIVPDDGTIDVDQVRFDGTPATDKTIVDQANFGGKTWFDFGSGDQVPDGSHLVVTNTDSAGNTNSTLLVLEDKTTNDVDFPLENLSGYNIGAIDLEVAYNTDLTISVADIKALSDNDDNLIIHGGADDKVTLEGTATVTGNTQVINNLTYKVVDLGDDSTLLINDDIDFFTI